MVHPLWQGKRSECFVEKESDGKLRNRFSAQPLHIHQEAMVVRVLKINDLTKIVVKCVIFINKSGLHHCQFKIFLEECGAGYKSVVYFSAVRWLNNEALLR